MQTPVYPNKINNRFKQSWIHTAQKQHKIDAHRKKLSNSAN